MKHRKIFMISIATVFVAIVIFFMVKTSRIKQRRQDFLSRGLTGVIIDIEDHFRGNYSLTIRQHQTKRNFVYDLQIGKFLKDNNIMVNDSISKVQNDGTVIFYKKGKSGNYEYCCNIKYYR